MTTEPETRSSLPADWQLERFFLGELPSEEMETVRRAAAADPELQRRLAAMQDSNRQVLQEHPAPVVLAGIRARLAAAAMQPRAVPRPFWALKPMWAGACAIVALTVIALHLTPPMTLEPEVAPESDVTRIKGLEPQLLLYRKTADGVERLSVGGQARTNDVIQLAYQAAGRRYGVIVSLDGRGVITRHLPVAGDQAAPLKAGAPVPLTNAYRLDDAPDWERFYWVTANQEFPVAIVTEAVRRAQNAAQGENARALGLPAYCETSVVVLHKESVR
ncbi:MAG: ActD-like protein [Vicinamibacteria bacterium]|jgi:hypothetical protein|nr:ActD-like protein [Vicinamibacteria bacterium]